MTDIDNQLFFDGLGDGVHAEVDKHLRAGDVSAAKNSSNALKDEAQSKHCFALIAIWEGKGADALRFVEAADSLSNKSGKDVESASVKITLARAHLLNKDGDDAYSAAFDALDKFKTGSSKIGEAMALNMLAMCELSRGNGDECMERVDASIALFKELGKVLGEASALHTKAMLFTAAGGDKNAAKNEGERRDSIFNLQQGLSVSEEVASMLESAGDDRRYAAALFAITQSASLAGDLDRAIEASQSGLQVLESKNFDKPQQVEVLLSLCGMYFKQDMFAKGLDEVQKVLSICQGDKKSEAQAHFMGAQLKRAKMSAGGAQWPPKSGIKDNEIKDMQDSAQHAVNLFEEVQDDAGEAGARFELAHAFLAKGELNRGIQEVTLAQTKFGAAGDNSGQCIAYLIGSQAQSHNGDKDSAMSSAEYARDLATDIGNVYLQRVCNDWIKKITPPKIEEKKTAKDASEGPSMTGAGQDGGIAPSVYASCIYKYMTVGEFPGEHFSENPTQMYMLEQALGCRFPFFRHRPALNEGMSMMEMGQAFEDIWKKPPKPAVAKLLDTKKKPDAASAPSMPSGANLKKPRLAPMAVPQPQRESASKMAAGSDLLGGCLPDVPPEVHEEMVKLASEGLIPKTTPDDRAGFALKRPTFYGDAMFRTAARFGYIHPTHTAPQGKKWKSVRAGAFKLVDL